MPTSKQRIAATTVIWVVALLLAATRFASAQAAPSGDTNPFHQDLSSHLPLEIGALVQGGTGVTQNRDGFKFFMAGVHAGKVLTPNVGPGPLHGNFEYAVEIFPFWQSYTPKFQRPFCTNPPGTPELHPLLHRRRYLHRSFHHSRHLPLEHRWHSPLLLLGPGSWRCPLDQPQVPGLRRAALQLAKRRPQRRRQRLELHTPGRRRRTLLCSSSPLH